ncbi:MAG: radical SAM family heme chaperone HemW [Chitinophagales bacterium]|nr:radical SAM family heme chaperone HemW [Chitinophagales bacterium]
MAGIYIHIPFCKQACHYCNFHFSNQINGKNDFIEALLKEIEMQKGYLNNKAISTIYFGGGTPSLLEQDDVKKIFEKLHQYFTINPDAEITFEANPDDLTTQKLSTLRALSINRLSIGIQSFIERDLKFMNRAHDSLQARTCVEQAKNEGFNNISIDLIYGLPDLTNEEWETTLQTAFELSIQHISSYCLTVEPKTALAKSIEMGRIPKGDEEKSATQFEILMKRMAENQFLHYEISNFCRERYYSRHNSNYWNGEWYLGLGPSAHSFNGQTRQWNISNNYKYINSIFKKNIPFERESLTNVQQLNEYIMTSLRTHWGCDLKRVKNDFRKDYPEVRKNLEKISSDYFLEADEKIFLTEKGKLVADRIILEMIV